MTCRRSHEIDLAAYLVDPAAPETAEFRAHYPTCADCSGAVASWAELEAIVRAANNEPERAHPPEELLLSFQNRPEELRPEDRDSIRLHIEACRACRDGLAALASFDFAALRREYSADVATSPAQAGKRRWGGLLPSLRDFLASLTPSIPVPVQAMALFLVIAIPSGLALWWMVSGQSIPSSPGAEIASTGLEAEATVPSPESVPESEPKVAVSPHAAPPPSLALAPPDSVIPDLGIPPEPEPTPEAEEPAPRGPETLAEVAEPPPTRVAIAPPPTAEEAPPVREVPPQVQVAESEAPPGSESEAEAQEVEPDPGTLMIALAALDPPLYAMPSFAVSPARIDVVIRRGPPDLPMLRALVPDHTGLTLRESPVLYWFASARTEFSIELTLIDEESIAPVLEVTLNGPVEPGIHAVDLFDHGVKLAPGVPYRWFVSISTDDERTTHDLVSGGVIQRIEPAAALRSELDEGDPSQRGHTLAANGVWYDALDFISGGIDRSPGEASLRDQRIALLEQVGLPEVADHERRFRAEPSAR